MRDLSGQIIGGQFKLLELVGEGATSVIYRAQQESMDRAVAVKMLLGEFTRQPDFLERFAREARVTAHLNHIHILRVYHYDHFAGTPYLVTPFIGTGTLADQIRSGPIPIDTVLRLGKQIASALDHAHTHAVIHRDVKSRNVLIDTDGNALLCDFGLAKLAGADTTALTATDTLIGTPDYMSPEQCSGLPADTRSDMYSLAALLYEMIAGHVPFIGENPLATVLLHIDGPIPDVPNAPHLNPFFQKALAKDPNQRYQSARDMLDALKRAVYRLDDDDLYRPINQAKARNLTTHQTAPLLDDDTHIPVEVNMSQVLALLDQFYTPAIAEANRLDQGYLGVEHVFIAMARYPKGILASLLARQNVDVSDLIQTINQYVGRGDGPLFKGGLRPTPRLMDILQIAADAARSQQRFTPTLQELLIAILQEGESIPVRLLDAMDIDTWKMLEILLAEYEGAFTSSSAHHASAQPLTSSPYYNNISGAQVPTESD